jgi:hypothetical protein
MSSTRSFGIVTSLTGLTAGICVNSLDTNETVETAEARNETGAITDLAGYSQRREITVTGVLDSAKGELITAGSKLTLGGKDYLVNSVQRRESNQSFCEITLGCVGADEAEIYIVNETPSDGQ